MYTPASVGKIGILSVKKNDSVITRYRPDLGNAEINIPTSDVRSSTTGKFNTTTGGILDSCDVKLEPKQDLHGYSKPWVGGAGKNKLPLTVSSIKALNTDGTWDGNEYTIYGVTYKLNTDSSGNITSIKATGTSTSNNARLFFLKNVTHSDYPLEMIINGCPSGGSSSSYYFRVQLQPSPYSNVNTDYGSGATVSIPDDNNNYQFYLRVVSGYEIQSSGIVFYPMLRLATVTDATFEPYTNICGITGHSSVEVNRTGKNLIPLTLANLQSLNTTGTWSGNRYTFANGTIVDCLTDDDGNIIGIKASGSHSASDTFNFNLASFTFESGILYKLNGITGGSNSTYRINVAGIGNFIDGDNSITGDGSSHTIRVQFLKNYTSPDFTVYPMLRYATNTDATFEPYNGTDYTINLGGTYYGGSLDVVSGVLTVTWAGVDMGAISYYKYADGMFRYDAPNGIISGTSGDDATDSICSYYPIYSDTVVAVQNIPNGYYQKTPSSSYSRYYFRNDDYTSETAFANAMSGQTFCYKLATPLTIQLTPQQINTLIGENHLDIPLEGQSLESLSYREMFAWDDVEDVVEELDEKKADISAIGIDESERTTASRSYSRSEHFYKDGKFCTAIASIASGATFTLNTNYVEGDISEYMNVETGALTVASNFSSSVTIAGGKAYRYGNNVKVQVQISVSGMTSFSGSSTTILNLPWSNVNYAVFGQINKSSDNYDMITDNSLFISNGGNGLRVRKTLPDGSYYLNIDYMTYDSI